MGLITPEGIGVGIPPTGGAALAAGQFGLAAARPAAGSVAAGFLYYATDTNTLSESDGVGTWTAISAGGAGTTFTWTPVKTANYTAANGDAVPCNVSGGGFTVTSPAAAINNRFRAAVVNSGSNTLTIALASGTLPGGATSTTVTTQGTTLDFSCYDGTNWVIT